MPTLHILIVTPAYPPLPGGGERYAAALATNLSARGHQVTVVTSAAVREIDFWQGRSPSPVDTDSKQNPRIIRCAVRPMPGGKRALLAWRKAMVLFSGLPGANTDLLLRMASRVPAIAGLDEALSTLNVPVDVVHGFNISWEHALVAGWRYARSEGIPFVATPFAHLGSDGKDKVALNSTMGHQRQLMRDADALVVLTAIEAEWLRQHGTAPAEVVVVGPGLDPLPPVIDGQMVMGKIDFDKPFALFIGRASYDKGAIHAAQAVLSLRQQGVHLGLVLVGQTSEEFERFLEKLTPEEKRIIRWVGIIDESMKHALLEQSEMLMLPSRTDSFGIVLLEAWAHGKPVIAARAGGIPGVVDDGVNGILLPFGDVQALAGAAQLLLEDEALNRRMGEAGREKVEKQYNWGHSTDLLLKVYQSVMQRPIT